MIKIIAIIRKDIALRFTSPSEWLFFLILPLVFTLLLAGGTPSGDEDNRVNLVVVDGASTDLADDLLSELERSNSVQIEIMTKEEAEKGFDERRIISLLIIPNDFDRDSLESANARLEIRQQPNNINAMVAEHAVQTAAQRVGSAVQVASTSTELAEAIQPFDSQADRNRYFSYAMKLAQSRLEESSQQLQITSAQVIDEDPVDYDPAANSSAGQLITWVFIPLLGISGLFAFERQQGTLRRLLISPTSRANYLFGTILGQVLTALLQIGLLVSFGIWVMKLSWGNNLGGLVILMVSFSLASAALGTALGTIVKTDSQASGMSIMLGMVMALMGGCWYPIELFPDFVRSFVKILPTSWAMQGMLDLVSRGGGFTQVLPETSVLLVFAGVFFTLGIWRFKYE